MKIIMMVWLVDQCGPAEQFADLLLSYGIDGVTIKVLHGENKYNAANGDKPLMDFIAVLRAKGLEVEGWGYHYPERPGPQGDAIEERRQKLGLTAYQLNLEGEWGVPGAGSAFETLASKLKVGGFEVTVCSYRFPTQHPALPWNKMDHQDAVDGWTPQVYWALNNNPVEQLKTCLGEYYNLSKKPVYPVGPTFGQSFETSQGAVYWMPKLEELEAFRQKCESYQFEKIYYYRIDQVVAKGWWDMLKAATGNNPAPLPPPPEPGVGMYFKTLLPGQAVRSEPTTRQGNVTVILRKPQGVIVGPIDAIHVMNYHEVWAHIPEGWIAIVHGGTVYLEEWDGRTTATRD